MPSSKTPDGFEVAKGQVWIDLDPLKNRRLRCVVEVCGDIVQMDGVPDLKVHIAAMRRYANGANCGWVFHSHGY